MDRSGNRLDPPMTDPVGSVRVVIVDQVLARAALRALLSEEPMIDIVAEADDADDAYQAVVDLEPDVVIVDINVPSINGLNLAEKIMANDDIKSRVLVLTTSVGDESAIESLRVGVSGFMLKDARPRELVYAIHIVAQGHAWITPRINYMLLERFRSSFFATSNVTTAAAIEDLTAREVEVLQLVARGQSNAEIATSLGVAETTVKTHVGRMLMKIGVRDRVRAVVWAYDVGLVVPGGV